jgi:hypothetical protein
VPRHSADLLALGDRHESHTGRFRPRGFEALPSSVTIGTLLQTYTAFVVEVSAIAEASAGREEVRRAH